MGRHEFDISFARPTAGRPALGRARSGLPRPACRVARPASDHGPVRSSPGAEIHAACREIVVALAYIRVESAVRCILAILTLTTDRTHGHGPI